MGYQAKLLTIRPQIVSKKSYLSILVNDKFQYCTMIDAVEFCIHFFIRRKLFSVNTFTFVSFYLGVLHDVTPLEDYKFLNKDRG